MQRSCTTLFFFLFFRARNLVNVRSSYTSDVARIRGALLRAPASEFFRF